VRAAKRSNRID